LVHAGPECTVLALTEAAEFGKGPALTDAYQVRLQFRSDDGRVMMSGDVEQRFDGPFPLSSTVESLVEAMKPSILEQFPHIGSGINWIEVAELRVRISTV
jgi:hypothetical protein